MIFGGISAGIGPAGGKSGGLLAGLLQQLQLLLTGQVAQHIQHNAVDGPDGRVDGVGKRQRHDKGVGAVLGIEALAVQVADGLADIFARCDARFAAAF